MLLPSVPKEKYSSSTVEKISEIQNEMNRIKLHQTEHVVLVGRSKEIRRLDRSCRYCSIYFENNPSPARQQDQIAPPVGLRLNEKKPAASKDLERTVDIAGKKGCVVVPRSWAGKRVKVILL